MDYVLYNAATTLYFFDYKTVTFSSKKVVNVTFLLRSGFCRITIHLGQVNKKRMKDRAKSVKVELPHNNLTKGGHILHEQEYNTGHGVQAIPDEIRGEIRRQPCQPEI